MRLEPRALLAPSLALALASPAAAQSTLYDYGPGELGDRPRSARLVGDVDGDGLGDVAFVSGGGAASEDEVRVVSGATGLALYAAAGTLVAPAGDVDGDGLPDVLVRDAAHGVLALRGHDGAVLLHVPGTGLEAVLSFAGVGDWDGDGRGELVVGTSGLGGLGAGKVVVRSGLDGAVLAAVPAFAPQESFGFDVARVGDVDGDGRDDVVVGAPALFDPTGAGAGHAYVLAAPAGALLHAFAGAQAGEAFGHAVDGAGDVDGDGVPDVVVGAPLADGAATDAGAVRVLSGATGLLLVAVPGAHAGGRLGLAVSGAGDVDGDGRADVAAGEPGAPGAGGAAGRVVVLSGAGGGELAELVGHAPGGGLGESVDAGLHVAGDRVPDVVAAAPEAPELRVASPVTLALASDEHVLPAAAGGTAGFALQAGPAAAGLPYVLLGSASGAQPGVALPGGVVLPLVPDAYLALSASPGSPLVGGAGVLDATGAASASFVLAPGAVAPPAAVTLYHAYVVLDPATGTAALASRPVPLTLLP